MREFEFPITITRAFKNDNGEMFLEGEASNTKVDLYDTVFTEECQQGFIEDIESAVAEGEPLKFETEHKGDWAPFFNLGAIVEGTLSNTRTNIIVRLDEGNPIAQYYYTVLSDPDPKRGRPTTLGLSINGGVIAKHSQYNAEVGKVITYFDRVKLFKVGIVKFPANTDCYVDIIKRSIENEEDNSVAEQETETPEVVVETEVVAQEEQDNGQQEEASEASAESGQQEQPEAGSASEVTESAEQQVQEEVTAEEVVADVVVETTETEVVVEAPLSTDHGVAVVERGLLADSLRADEMNEELREVGMLFRDQLAWLQYTVPLSDGVTAMRDLVNEYADIVDEILKSYTASATKRELNSGDTAVQTEDLSSEITEIRSLRDLLKNRVERSQKATGQIVKRELQKEETMSQELNDKIEALTRSFEGLEAINKELVAQNAELVKRNEELAAKPVATPAAVAQTQVETPAPRNAVREALDAGDVKAAIKYGFGISKPIN